MAGAYSPWQMMSPNVGADVNAWKPVVNMPPPGAMLAAVPAPATVPAPPKMSQVAQQGYGPVKNPMENVAPGAAPQTYEQLLQALKARGDQMAEEQRRGADFQRQTLPHVVKGDLQYDLSPLAALVDQWSGSNLARAYKAPETGQQRQAQIAGLRKGVTDADQQASATEMAALKALADGTFDLQKFNADEKYKKDMLAVQREAIRGKQIGGGKQSEAIKTVDRKFGAMYAEDVIGGNFAGAQNEIANLKDLQNRIATGQMGTVSGSRIAATPEFMGMRAAIHPKAVEAQQAVEKAVQASMRASLGAQFTEKEGAQLLARTWDPKLSQQENARRLGILVNGLERAADAKRGAYEYYEAKGTMAGYQGSPNIEGDFLNSVKTAFDSKGGSAPSPFSNMTDEQLEAIAKGQK
jgi:hypothetical protein